MELLDDKLFYKLLEFLGETRLDDCVNVFALGMWYIDKTFYGIFVEIV